MNAQRPGGMGGGAGGPGAAGGAPGIGGAVSQYWKRHIAGAHCTDRPKLN